MSIEQSYKESIFQKNYINMYMYSREYKCIYTQQNANKTFYRKYKCRSFFFTFDTFSNFL